MNSTQQYLIDIAKIGGVFALVDLPFLYFITTYFYNDLIPSLTGQELAVPKNFRNISSIFLAYFAMTIAHKELVVNDRSAIILGLAIYATYSFTNMVIFQQWDWKLAVIETLWGGLLYWLVHKILSYFQGNF